MVILGFKKCFRLGTTNFHENWRNNKFERRYHLFLVILKKSFFFYPSLHFLRFLHIFPQKNFWFYHTYWFFPVDVKKGMLPIFLPIYEYDKKYFKTFWAILGLEARAKRGHQGRSPIKKLACHLTNGCHVRIQVVQSSRNIHHSWSSFRSIRNALLSQCKYMASEKSKIFETNFRVNDAMYVVLFTQLQNVFCL